MMPSSHDYTELTSVFEMCGMVLLLGSSDLNLQFLGGGDKAPPVLFVQTPGSSGVDPKTDYILADSVYPQVEGSPHS